MKDIETKNRFVELRAQGKSFDSIAQELQISKQTLITWSKELAIDINNLKTMELDALREKFYLSKKAKVEMFGTMLENLKQEIGKRDIAKIPTKELFELFLKTYGILSKEDIEPVLKVEEDDFDFRRMTSLAV